MATHHMNSTVWLLTISHISACKFLFRPVVLRWPLTQMASQFKSNLAHRVELYIEWRYRSSIAQYCVYKWVLKSIICVTMLKYTPAFIERTDWPKVNDTVCKITGRPRRLINRPGDLEVHLGGPWGNQDFLSPKDIKVFQYAFFC